MRKKLSLLFMALFLFMGVPQMAQAAEYPYEVEVNLTQNVVTVYKKDAAGKYTVPDRAFVCSVGPATPTGTFRTTDNMYGVPCSAMFTDSMPHVSPAASCSIPYLIILCTIKALWNIWNITNWGHLLPWDVCV